MTAPTRVVSWPLSVEPYWRRVPGAAALLHAIAEEPDDLLAHRALADLCNECGEHARADFIRRQVDSDDGRDDGPINANAARWLEGLPALNGVDWRRCFFRGLLCRAGVWTPSAFDVLGPLFRAADIRRLGLPQEAEDVRPPTSPAPAEWLDRLTHLEAGNAAARVVVGLFGGSLRSANLCELRLTDSYIDAVALEAITASGGLDRLRGLDLSDNPVNDDGCAVLARCRLPSLEILDLTRTGVGDEGVLALCSSGVLSGVRELYLRGSEICDRGAVGLASTLRGGLRVLDLSDNRIGREGAEALARAPFAPTITDLRLGDNPLGVAGVATAGRWFRKTDRPGELCRAGIGDDDILDLPALLGTGPVGHLDLGDNPLSAVGVRRLASLDVLRTITALTLGGERLDSAGLFALLDSPHLDALESLCLLACDIAPPFTPARLPPRLRWLTLSDTPFGRAGVEWLASALAGAALEHLDLNNAGLGRGAVSALAAPAFFGLQSLCMSHNGFGDGDVFALAEMSFAPRLTSLNLRNNDVSWDAVEFVLRSGRFPALVLLDVSGNGLEPDAPRRLAEIPRPAVRLRLHLSGNFPVRATLRDIDPSHWYLES